MAFSKKSALVVTLGVFCGVKSAEEVVGLKLKMLSSNRLSTFKNWLPPLGKMHQDNPISQAMNNANRIMLGEESHSHYMPPVEKEQVTVKKTPRVTATLRDAANPFYSKGSMIVISGRPKKVMEAININKPQNQRFGSGKFNII